MYIADQIKINQNFGEPKKKKELPSPFKKGAVLPNITPRQFHNAFYNRYYRHGIKRVIMDNLFKQFGVAPLEQWTPECWDAYTKWVDNKLYEVKILLRITDTWQDHVDKDNA